MQNLIHYLRQAALKHQGVDLTDRQLLAGFQTGGDNSAFATLVHRHGPMVLAAARRVLGNAQDAEDVFQATFLVLVRKAHTLRKPDLLANWLYGVAYRTALEAKTLNARRRAREIQVEKMPEVVVPEPETCLHLLEMLDEELSRLGEKYRAAVVLCDLESRSRKEAAKLLHIPEGTLSSRLATAHKQLARRLARRGLALSASALGVGLAGVAQGQPGGLLVAKTLQAAGRMIGGCAEVSIASERIISLVNGVAKAMLISKLKVSASVLLALGLIGLALGVAVQGMFASLGFASSATQVDKPKDKLPEAGPAKSKTPLKAQPELAKKDVIKPGDRLEIMVTETLPNQPINRVYVARPNGRISLGFGYGGVDLTGLEPDEAVEAIRKHLSNILRNPLVCVDRPDPGPHAELVGQVQKLELRVLRLEVEVLTLRGMIEKSK